ncbi:2'-5'-oligoadenylate synthase 2 isoform X3 [Apodemus sylvaticus]|uniref:2'-5'-oligoadenylate synthase 2 isoform X3 n=1 Tax=Apodemus sylvaticus TaxID=10129 RepID=UPI002242EB27|nr:2'-5'-oligoadenylate synthase 2 isoform X3 [Apodemus sylvaticus]
MENWLTSWSPGWPFGGSSGVSSVPADKLEEYIRANLKPNEASLKQIDQAVDTISDLLRSEIPVMKVAKGGSYGRGTVLRGRFDGTLVLFMDCFQQFQDQKKNQDKLLDTIEQRLKSYVKYRMSVNRGYALVVQVSTPEQSISLQLLPAFNPLRLVNSCLSHWSIAAKRPHDQDNSYKKEHLTNSWLQVSKGVSENPSSQVYRNLKQSMDRVGATPGEFSDCFTTLQEQFFKKYPRRLKDLILLVKHWYEQCQGKCASTPQPLLYALELLTVYAWEQGSQAEDFDMAQGVRTVLQLISQPTNLCVYWTVNYNFEDETVRNNLLYQLNSQRPVILDPSDPTNNVGKDDGSWQILAEKARAWLYSPSLNNESPAPYWDVLPRPLFVTPTHLLDKFIQDFLQPNKVFLEQIKRAVDIICSFLKENCFRNSDTKVLKAVKGGSTAKGTALKQGSDADIVVFLSSLNSYDSLRTQRTCFVQEIQRQLEACKQAHELEVKFEMSKWPAPRVLSFTLKSKSLNESVEFDVLPAYDALELQKEFIETRPTKLKNLIRLIKHWYKQYERKMKPKASLPPKYALELLTVYTWEQGSGTHDFNTAEGFRTVLDLIIKYQQLCIFWTVNYNFEEEHMRKFLLTQIRKKRPVILDPADPTGDVGGGDRWRWDLLAEEAKEWLSSPCFQVEQKSMVEPWKVPLPLPLPPGSADPRKLWTSDLPHCGWGVLSWSPFCSGVKILEEASSVIWQRLRPRYKREPGSSSLGLAPTSLLPA